MRRRSCCRPTAALLLLLWLLAMMFWAPPVRAGTGVDSDQQARAARGQQLLARYHCGRCHTIPGVPAARGRLAAPLAQYGKRSYIAGRVANRPDLLARWIMDPQSVVPGTLMPDMGVTADDARDIAAYLGRLE